MFFAKIPRHTRQNVITEGDFKCILARNCEGTEQLQSKTDSTQTGYFLRNIQFESNLFFCNYTLLTSPKPLSATKIPALDLSRNRHIRPA